MDAHWSMQLKRTLSSLDRLDYSSWFDLWHTHPDFKSKGNRFPELRTAVARITYEAFLHAEQLVAASRQSVQVFATICADTGDNAVYLHTANPNGTPYPHEFHGITWGVSLPAELLNVVNLSTHHVGLLTHDGVIQYVVCKRAAAGP